MQSLESNQLVNLVGRPVVLRYGAEAAFGFLRYFSDFDLYAVCITPTIEQVYQPNLKRWGIMVFDELSVECVQNGTDGFCEITITNLINS